MTTALMWLDNSADEQKRVNEFISYFTERSTQDEMGIGQVRDAFSDLLFPGTSTLQTRARYFLIVPWCFKHPGRNSGRKAERLLIPRLADEEGAFGSRTGTAVQRLPSDAYWGGLVRFGILRRDIGRESVAPGDSRELEVEEQVGRALGDWHPTLPPPADGFPSTIDGGLRLTRDEADWLRERILDAAPGTLLAHLAMSHRSPDDESRYPWSDSLVAEVPEPVQRLLSHSRRFSMAVTGMQRLYGLLVSEAQHERFQRDEKLEAFRQAWHDYLGRLDRQLPDMRAWDLSECWDIVLGANPRIGARTRLFVEQFVALMRLGSQRLNSDASRDLIIERERSLKRTQSRFENHRLLGGWQGSPGGGGLEYRWPNVKRLLADLQEGLHDAGA